MLRCGEIVSRKWGIKTKVKLTLTLQNIHKIFRQTITLLKKLHHQRKREGRRTIEKCRGLKVRSMTCKND